MALLAFQGERHVTDEPQDPAQRPRPTLALEPPRRDAEAATPQPQPAADSPREDHVDEPGYGYGV
jgi:hypothetical protein